MSGVFFLPQSRGVAEENAVRMLRTGLALVPVLDTGKGGWGRGPNRMGHSAGQVFSAFFSATPRLRVRFALFGIVSEVALDQDRE